MLKEDNNTLRPDISHLRIASQDKEERPIGKWLILIGVVATLLVCAGIFLYFFHEPVLTVKVVTAEQSVSGQEHTILNASGYVTPRRRATIAAKITGQVVEMRVDEGMRVAKGEILARFDDVNIKAMIKTLEAEVDATEATVAEISVNLKNTERNLERNRSLYQAGVITARDLDDTKTLFDGTGAKLRLAQKQIEVSRNRLSEMKQELTNYTITAPFAGIVVSKDAQVGEIVSPVSAGGGYTRTGIATIVDMESLEIEVDINESFIAKVTIGQKVTATLDAYPDWRIPARVRTVIPTADRQKATVKVRIAFEALDPKILPDMGVKVAFMEAVAEPEDSGNRVCIPMESVRRDADKPIAFIYKEGTIESRPVKTGPSNATSIEILAGIMPGELVVVGNITNLQNGQKARLATGT
jgi:RND family efflux transporter MFP subunit